MPSRPAGPSVRKPPTEAAPTAQHEEERFREVWLGWVDKLATDAESAVATSMAYGALEPSVRDRWIELLSVEAARLEVPRIAIFAPLLAVETDPERRGRLTELIGPADQRAEPPEPPRALVGRRPDGARVLVAILPLYLRFSQILLAVHRAGEHFIDVRHDPIVDGRALPRVGDEIAGARLETGVFADLVDELAITVVAHRRQGLDVPAVLRGFAHLFGPPGSEGRGR